MRLLVTGANGEVGSGTLRALARRAAAGRCPAPEAVFALDLRVAPDLEALGLPLHRLELDLRGTDVAALVRETGCDTALHAAALTGVAAESDPAATLALNFELLASLAEALPSPRGRLLLTSAVAAIGRHPPDRPADEAAPQRPISHYGLSKARGERLLRELRRDGLLDARALRLPTLLVRRGGRSGPPSTGFLSDLVKAFRADRPFIAPAAADFAVAVNAGRVATEALATALTLPRATWGDDAVANLPAFPLTGGELLAALQAHHGRPGPEIGFLEDPGLMARAGGWPKAMTSRLAEELVPPDGRERAACLGLLLAEPQAV
jgi:nucleoside-diphosphate-sugar epimerase